MSPLTWAVAAVVTDASGRLLLCRRSERARRWGLPGGRLRHDESPADAVVRAVRAETGWAVAPADLVGLHRVTDPRVPAPPAGSRSRMIDTSSARWRCPGVLDHASSAKWSRSSGWRRSGPRASASGVADSVGQLRAELAQGGQAGGLVRGVQHAADQRAAHDHRVGVPGDGGGLRAGAHAQPDADR